MSKRPVVKNIEIVTNYKRKPRRNPGDVSYPITYSNQMADFDIWHHMFLANYCRNLTMCPFTDPPRVVLDLGCGTGYWAIEAAKRWPDSKVYGFDIAHIQPRLERIGGFCSLSKRVEWVHGNFLDGLPFQTDFFDFVRIASLGLAIPEDEWQFVLEDVRRVLKPGAPLEIIEEDLLFPCSSILLQKSREHCSPISAVSCPPYSGLHRSKSAVFYERSNTLSERHLPTFKSKTDFQDYQSKLVFAPPCSTNPLSPPSPVSPVSSNSTSETEHPQDHSRLKIAWDAMLTTRFLSPNLLSVLPFYLTSSSFSTVSTLSHLSVPLPPNSGKVPNIKASHFAGKYCDQPTPPTLADTLFDFSARTPFRSASTSESLSFQLPTAAVQTPQAPAWATMHLAKTLNTIQGCKEAIYAEYYKLYFRDALHILSRTSPTDVDDYSFQPPKIITRRAFEVDWKNWELDMIDRIGMHKNLLVHAAWTQSVTESSHDPPEWRKWRKKLERNSTTDMNNEHLVIGYNPNDLCCSMRIFTAFKF